ncbi:hypothetical protein [Amycolatopsis sp.]|uniref:hypothetical protein n=1 Tax=Amycolatopsis sp. TaxID=37632 RepID=UPI002D7E55E4|nr:hypothetical protein [Amycolatopsis sp.]HET6710310.1 hypothetical protein [Amycolatopsis sp.]
MRSTQPRPHWGALLGEVLFVGVLVCLASVFVVTSLAAAAAGAVLLAEVAADGRTPTVRRFARLFRAALAHPVALLAPAGLLAVGGVDVVAVLGGLPGGRVFGAVLGLVLAALLAAGLRGAAAWRPGRRWPEVLTAAGRETVSDWRGSVGLVVAIVVVAVVVTQAPAFVVVAPGLLVLAAVAVRAR